MTANFGDVDSFNETLAATRRGLPLAQVIADLAFARDMVQQAVAACPEDRLDAKHFNEASPDGGIAHETEHAEVIAAWREKERL